MSVMLYFDDFKFLLILILSVILLYNLLKGLLLLKELFFGIPINSFLLGSIQLNLILL